MRLLKGATPPHTNTMATAQNYHICCAHAVLLLAQRWVLHCIVFIVSTPEMGVLGGEVVGWRGVG